MIATQSATSNAVMLMTLAMVNGGRRKHLAKHLFLQLAVDGSHAPTAVVSHWRPS
jgi:hypothetical protein